MKCDRCKERIEELIPDSKITSWYKLLNYLEHELHEGEISNTTFEDLTDALSFLRPKEDLK